MYPLYLLRRTDPVTPGLGINLNILIHIPILLFPSFALYLYWGLLNLALAYSYTALEVGRLLLELANVNASHDVLTMPPSGSQRHLPWHEQKKCHSNVFRFPWFSKTVPAWPNVWRFLNCARHPSENNFKAAKIVYKNTKYHTPLSVSKAILLGVILGIIFGIFYVLINTSIQHRKN